MVLGIVSIAAVTLSCCCCGIYGPLVGAPVSGVCAVTAISLGYMGKTPGSEGYANAGMICACCALGLIAVMIVLAVTIGGFAFLMDQQNQGR